MVLKILFFLMLQSLVASVVCACKGKPPKLHVLGKPPACPLPIDDDDSDEGIPLTSHRHNLLQHFAPLRTSGLVKVEWPDLPATAR